MATKIIDFTSLNPVTDHVINNIYQWGDWDTVNVGPGIYKADCERVIERVTTGSSVTVTYDSDNDRVETYSYTSNYLNSDSENVTENFNVVAVTFSNVSDSDAGKDNYWFKTSS